MTSAIRFFEKRRQRIEATLAILLAALSAYTLLVGNQSLHELIPIPPKEAKAAQVTIDTTVSITIGKHMLSGKQTVCTSDTACYAFYIDATPNAEDIAFVSSTNGGASWGTPHIVAAGTWLGVVIWYDRWTPGDTTGNTVHMVTFESTLDRLYYTSFDTVTEATTSVVDASGAAEGALAAGNDLAITKATNGYLYLGTVDATAPTAGANFIEKCPANCTATTSWVAAGTNTWTNAGDNLDGNFDLVMMPLPAGDIMLVARDVALEDIEYQIYTSSTNTWNASFTDLDTGAQDITTFPFTISGIADTFNNDLYLAYVASTSVTNRSELRAWRYSSSTWAQLASPWPEATDAVSLINDVSIGMDYSSGDLYVAYVRDPTNDATNNGNVYYSKSTDGGTTWTIDTLLSNGTVGDLRGISINNISNERIFGVWFNPTPDDIFGNTAQDLTPPTFSQSAYRWFENTNATSVGVALAAQDTATTLTTSSQVFRLRLSVDAANNGGRRYWVNAKLQYATSTGACDVGYSGETYIDVATSSGPIILFDNALPLDGATSTATSSDPVHGGHPATAQTYEEANPFTNSISRVASGTDGIWDFALKDNNAPTVTTYCFRIVDASGSLLGAPSVIPQVTTFAVPTYTQNYYRWYVDNGTTTPSDPWPSGAVDIGENAPITYAQDPPASGEHLRLRMTSQIGTEVLATTTQDFKLQFGTPSATCGDVSSWNDLGALGSGVIWRGWNSAPADGTVLASSSPQAGELLLSVSDRGGTYEEQNGTGQNPYRVNIGEDVEYDWSIEDNGATASTTYCFRMTKENGAEFGSYSFYPTLSTSGYRPKTQNWRWYDDEASETPTTFLAAENTAPTNIANQNSIKLRITIKDTANASGVNEKFKLQFSEYSDFSGSVQDVTPGSGCSGNSIWCYTDGGGLDNGIITTKVLSDADACTGGAGNGCGMHNEVPTSTSSFSPAANAATEYEFTIKQDGARASAVYFFRVYNVTRNLATPLNTSEIYPSLTVEGGSLTFSIGGVASGTITEGITTDTETTASTIPFGVLAFGADRKAAHRLTITTNATDGYRVFLFQGQGFINEDGDEIPRVAGTNASPLAWGIGCYTTSSGCYGYHSGDDVLFGGSTRFSADDTYAKLTTSSEEIAFSAIPGTADTHDVIFRTKASGSQPGGTYQSSIAYIAVTYF